MRWQSWGRFTQSSESAASDFEQNRSLTSTRWGAIIRTCHERNVQMKSGRFVSILAMVPFLGASLASAQTLTLDKTSYKDGEAIHIIWSGSRYPNDRIGIFRARFAPRDGVSNGPTDLWEYAVAPFGSMTFTTPLPPGDYVAHLHQNGGATTLTDGVPFTVTYGEGLGGIGARVLIGPNDPGKQLSFTLCSS